MNEMFRKKLSVTIPKGTFHLGSDVLTALMGISVGLVHLSVFLLCSVRYTRMWTCIDENVQDT